MKRNLLLSIFTLLLITAFTNINLQAQKWTGNGDGTSWDDPANWDSEAVPEAGAKLVFSKAAVLTGNVPNTPAQIKVQKNIEVTFDLDITLGDGVIAEHALTIGAGSTVNIGTEANGRTININVAPNKQGIAAFGANDNVTLNILEGSTVNAISTQFGVNLVNETAVMNNYGTIVVGQAVTTGLKTGGTYNNYGVIDATNAGNNGIITATGGSFINHEGGIIDIMAGLDDCIELQDGSSFTNNGTLTVAKGETDANGRFNSAIVVSGRTMPTTFINNSVEPLNISGLSDSSTIFQIDTMGVFENHSVVNYTGPNADSTFLVQGNLVNMAGATFNIHSGFVNVAETGNFTNDWILTMLDEASTFVTYGTALNNGFYNYANGGAFSDGGGMITDNGLPFVTTIDALGDCTIDLANLSLEWFEDGTLIGTSDETGALTFAEASLVNDPTTLTTSIGGIAITVENYCPEAWIDPANVNDLDERSNRLSVYPTLVKEGMLTVDMTTMESKMYTLQVLDLTGKMMNQEVLEGGHKHQVNLAEIGRGMYILNVKNTGQTARFVVNR